MSEKKSNNELYIKELSKQIDLVLNNKISSNNQIMVRKDTPKVLVENGVKNLPMLITQKHIKSIVYSYDEAKKLGLLSKDVINYHGLGKELLLRVLNTLDNPEALYQIEKENYLLVTPLNDNEDNKIIVLIKANAKGTYNNLYIFENQIKSIYGKNNLDKYISKNKFNKI